MKHFIAILAIFFSFASKADQLAYVTQEQAVEAAKKINKMSSVYLFCGCCTMSPPKKVKLVTATVRHTGYENYYEVVIEYKAEDGSIEKEAIDLAYTWKKGLFGYKTIGKMLNLEHDYCVNPKNWDDPENVEKDI